KEKDYVSRPKKSGYQSIHLIVEVPVSYYEKVENIRAEIQIRSFAMDYWAELDYQMCYKKSAGEVETIRKEISSYSDVMAEMDRKMIELRKRIEKETIKAGGRKS
ncbi:MAG: GTP pyrophosphokinase, partial [Lachnoclostridium sp.]|nr:GTP pyrophosphokinase [Lachnoclostridium sp.]